MCFDDGANPGSRNNNAIVTLENIGNLFLAVVGLGFFEGNSLLHVRDGVTLEIGANRSSRLRLKTLGITRIEEGNPLAYGVPVQTKMSCRCRCVPLPCGAMPLENGETILGFGAEIVLLQDVEELPEAGNPPGYVQLMHR